MESRDALFERIKGILVSEFQINEQDITPDSRLVDDFDLDSIDAADLIVKFKEYLPPKVDASMFREMHTINDLLNLLTREQK